MGTGQDTLAGIQGEKRGMELGQSEWAPWRKWHLSCQPALAWEPQPRDWAVWRALFFTFLSNFCLFVCLFPVKARRERNWGSTPLMRAAFTSSLFSAAWAP